MAVNEPHMSWLPAYGPLHQQNHPAPLCKVMKNDIFLSTFVKSLFVYTLRTIFACQLALKKVH